MTRKQSYFAKQKLIGFGIIIVSIIVGLIFKDAMLISLIFIPIGLLAIFTKQMIWVDSYFLEMEEDEECS